MRGIEILRGRNAEYWKLQPQTVGLVSRCWSEDEHTTILKCLLSGPGSCEIRDRRILHGVGDRSPPQCSADGEFLPVQCKFVNMTNMMVFDLVHSYNR